MKYLIVDTESSGLFDFSKPADAEGQPRLAHLGMLFVDESMAIEREASLYVKPDGWVMPAEAQAVNGLSMEMLAAKGIPVVEVLAQYSAAIEEGRVVVAYNAQYDCKMLRGELRRAGMPDLFDVTQNICVMRPCTGVCKIPKANGKGYKFPKLAEALAHFKFPQEAPHTAMDDARGAYRIFRKLKELGLCPEPEVHRAQPGTKAGEAAGLGPSKSTQRKAKAAAPTPIERVAAAPARPVSAEDEIPE